MDARPDMVMTISPTPTPWPGDNKKHCHQPANQGHNVHIFSLFVTLYDNFENLVGHTKISRLSLL